MRSRFCKPRRCFDVAPFCSCLDDEIKNLQASVRFVLRFIIKIPSHQSPLLSEALPPGQAGLPLRVALPYPRRFYVPRNVEIASTICAAVSLSLSVVTPTRICRTRLSLSIRSTWILKPFPARLAE